MNKGKSKTVFIDYITSGISATSNELSKNEIKTIPFTTASHRVKGE